MDSLFKKKPTLKEQTRDNERALRRVDRDVGRDRAQLEREEKKLEMDIKKAAKAGQKDVCTILAKQLIQIRKQKQRTFVASSQIKAAGFQAKAMGANVKIAEAMGETSKTMGNMNKIMDPVKMNKDMQAFAMANERMNMTEETMNDALDDILADSDDEAEQDLVVNQVLDEIGIEISGKMMKAPSVHAGTIGESTTKKKEDQDIEAMLAQLKG
ncbi:hypothetical protein TCAL_12479 [Tigriopus californicus]|uniref:Charged multivesicular body protein 2b n=1 Tax=Tigriopus californicus TaxID=6832 RepID=A0A553PI43_TIGCA|nr:charged multivesicular body protein 2b-like [Tigriopus californicus]TRY77349.1 hypothetical protein TCAL_12479 [Tigriopus californicus]|eukprot:TCALIF_12479-PA protein Name:"Similar to chmp2b Charged multivesicular body protein 2b (Xenopus tropicalis)" AED:0.09 eAED:0.09 QI:273/1/1/1/1/1/4/160/212